MAVRSEKIGSLEYYNEMLRTLARRANRRLERATEGQRSALEHYMRGYHTREKDGQLFFKAGKAQNLNEARARYREMQDFLSGQLSTRRGWEEIKKANIAAGAGTAREKLGYDLTDEEFAQIVKETGGESSKAFYRAMENVTAIKYEMKAAKVERESREWNRKITEAITERIDDQQATERLIRARKEMERIERSKTSRRRRTS